MLYLRRGTRQGASAGLCVGIATIFLLSPFFPMLAGDTFADLLGQARTMIDTGAWGLFLNILTFAVASYFTRSKATA